MEDNNNVNENIGETEGTSPAPPPPPQQDVTPPPPQQNYTPPPPSPDPAGGGSLTNPSKDERNWAMFAHLSGLVVGLIVAGVSGGLGSFLSFIGPLAIYLMKKDESAFVSDQAKEALNFHITVGIAYVIIVVLAILLVWTIIIPFLMILVGIGVAIGALILAIIAAIKSSNGELYRYPFILRLI